MTKLAPLITGGLCLLATVALAQQKAPADGEAPRQLGQHVHGKGKLTIAIEKRTVEMELEAPGADIVGFEHEAKTAEQNAKITAARAALGKPEGMFRLPQAAQCKAGKTRVKLVGHADHGHAHGHSQGKTKEKAGNKQAEAEAPHSEFTATYTFSCAKPELLQAIEVDYFKAFPNAQSLDVEIVGAKGAARQTVTRERPTIELKGAS